MAPLSDRVEDFDRFLDGENNERYENFEVQPGLVLDDLSEHKAWDGIMDLFASRTVFMRLWTFQEVGLVQSTAIMVLCGGVRM